MAIEARGASVRVVREVIRCLEANIKTIKNSNRARDICDALRDLNIGSDRADKIISSIKNADTAGFLKDADAVAFLTHDSGAARDSMWSRTGAASQLPLGVTERAQLVRARLDAESLYKEEAARRKGWFSRYLVPLWSRRKELPPRERWIAENFPAVTLTTEYKLPFLGRWLNFLESPEVVTPIEYDGLRRASREHHAKLQAELPEFKPTTYADPYSKYYWDSGTDGRIENAEKVGPRKAAPPPSPESTGEPIEDLGNRVDKFGRMRSGGG